MKQSHHIVPIFGLHVLRVRIWYRTYGQVIVKRGIKGKKLLCCCHLGEPFISDIRKQLGICPNRPDPPPPPVVGTKSHVLTIVSFKKKKNQTQSPLGKNPCSFSMLLSNLKSWAKSRHLGNTYYIFRTCSNPSSYFQIVERQPDIWQRVSKKQIQIT